MGSPARKLKRHQDRTRKKEAMTEPEHSHPEPQVQAVDEANQPDKDDIISTLLEEIREMQGTVANANDQRMFFKALTKKLQRRAEGAELAQTSLQARVDQLEAELAAAKGEAVDTTGVADLETPPDAPSADAEPAQVDEPVEATVE